MKRIYKLLLNFINRRGISFLLSAFLSVPIVFVASLAWFNASRNASFLKTLTFLHLLVFIFLIWIVWFITQNFLSWLKSFNISVTWKDYIILCVAVLSVVTAAYYGWNTFGDSKPVDTSQSTFEVEITLLDSTPGSICILEIKNQDGIKIQKETKSIYDLSLTGGWTSEGGNCQYYSDGSVPGSLKFNYDGRTGDSLRFLFRESRESGKVLIRVNGKMAEEIDLFSDQEGNKPVVKPLDLSRIREYVWNILGTAGYFAILIILLMSLTLLLKTVHLRPQISALIELINKRPWVGLVVVVIFALLMFWPRGALLSPDAAYYLSLAKNLYHGNGYVNPDLTPNIYRGPVFPILIALSYFLFGESFRSAVILERIFWFLTIVISYFLGKKLYCHRVGMLTSFFFLTTSVINITFYYIWTDGPLTLLMLLLLLMFWDTLKNQRDVKWYIFQGLLMGGTYLLKQTVVFMAPLPLLTWLIFSENRDRQTLGKLIVFYIVFALFYFGWDGYVYLAGGSSGQIIGTLTTGLNFLSYISRNITSASSGQNLALSEGSGISSSIAALLEIFDSFYHRDILSLFRIAIVFPFALVFTLFQAVQKKVRSDIFLLLGLFLYTPLILVQGVVNFGSRQNLFFYCIILLLLAAMIDRVFGHLSSKRLSSILILIVSASLIFIQASGNNYYNLLKPKPVKNRETLDYLSGFQEIATWVEEHVNPGEKILISARESNYLHILISGNRQFRTINTCMGEIGVSPAQKCTPPYISFWVYRGITDPYNPRDFLQGISENNLLSTIREKDVKYVFVTPSVYSLYYYLKLHPDFEEINIIDNVAIFRIIRPAHAISNYPNLEWTTCVGRGTPEYLENLKNTDPARYEMRLQTQFEPWMGLSEKDLEIFINWQGCQFEVNFPGSYNSSEK